jgi:Protein of unknown function (DUF3631)
MSPTGELLNEVQAFVRRYIVLSDEQATATALWTLHTHAVDVIGITPYLAITSAEKSSGKTLLLEVLEILVAKPWLTGSVSGATLARKIDADEPTLLLDESDAAFKGDKDYAEALRGVLNTGFKASGTYSRCVGSSGTNLKVQDFKTFSPKAIAGIGQLPDTVADRSIPIRLKKKTQAERVESFSILKTPPKAAPIKERIEAWAAIADEALGGLDLAALDELSDRANDIWKPLLGIAHVAGENWFIRARRSAVALSGRQAVDDESTGVQLLTDIWTVFEETGTDRLSSASLIAALHEIEESAWNEWYGKPITAHGVAKILKRYEVRPHSVRLEDGTTPKGYKREQFEDAWARYLPDPPSATATTPQPASLSGKQASSDRNTNPLVAVTEMAANPHGQRDVADVAVTNGGVHPDDPVQADLDYYRSKLEEPSA